MLQLNVLQNPARLDVFEPKPKPRPKPKIRQPVAIAIGMLCEGGILVATDSQTTYGTIKSQDAQKVRLMGVANCTVMIGESGNGYRSQRAIEWIEQLGQNTAVTDYRSIAEIGSAAMLRIKQEMRQQRLNCTMEELAEYIKQEYEDCTLMIAYYFGGKPYIFEVSLLIGVANQMVNENSRHFTVMGSGGELALYLMREFTMPKMETNTAMAALIYTIGEVKKHDGYCSGKTRCGWVGPPGCGTLHPQEIVDDIAAEIERYNEKSKGHRNKQIAAMLESVTRKWMRKLNLTVRPMH